MIVVLLVDLWVGVAFLIATASQTSSGAYDPARRVASVLPSADRVHAFGALLLVLTVAAVLLLRRPHLASPVIVALVGYWLFWVVAFGVAYFSNGHGSIVAALAVTQTWCHFMLARRLALVRP